MSGQVMNKVIMSYSHDKQLCCYIIRSADKTTISLKGFPSPMKASMSLCYKPSESCVCSGMCSSLEEHLLLQDRQSVPQAAQWSLLSLWQRLKKRPTDHSLLQRYTDTHNTNPCPTTPVFKCNFPNFKLTENNVPTP